MTDSDPTGMWRRETAWRAGSRRAVVDAIGMCWQRKVHAFADPRRPTDAELVDFEQLNAAIAWYASEAVAAGYIAADQVPALVGSDSEAAKTILIGIWDFGTDPALAVRRANIVEHRALLERLLSPDERAMLDSGDRDGSEAISRKLRDDPSYSSITFGSDIDWSLDWPAGTPAGRIGPGLPPPRGIAELDPSL